MPMTHSDGQPTDQPLGKSIIKNLLNFNMSAMLFTVRFWAKYLVTHSYGALLLGDDLCSRLWIHPIIIAHLPHDELVE